jgi:hypothetical protein
MRYSYTAALLLSGSAYALPAPQVSQDSGAHSPADPADVLNFPLPSDAVGSLRGSKGLLGYDSKNPVTTETTVIPPSDFEVAPGQSEDPDLGLYIDLTKVKNPQPLQGDPKAPTDPGPR